MLRTISGSKRSLPPQKIPQNATLYVLPAKKNVLHFQNQRYIISYNIWGFVPTLKRRRFRPLKQNDDAAAAAAYVL